MSTVAISYHDINQTARKADQVAQKLDSYASGINSRIINKLNNYQGGYSSDISSAISIAKQKVEILEEQAERQRSFSNDLFALEDECKSVDRAVKSRISSLTTSFRDAYNIEIGALDKVYSTVVSAFNSNVVTRWVKDKVLAPIDNWENELIGNIKHWYNYQGGKELFVGFFWAAVDIAIGIVTVVGAAIALAAGGSALAIAAAIAGIVLGVIGIVNGLTNLVNEARAVVSADKNPLKAYRVRKEDSLQDSFRETDSKLLHGMATAMDITVGVCAAITIVHSAGQITKKGFKWLTGSKAKLKDIKYIDEVFTKQTWDTVLTRGKDTINNTRVAFKTKNFRYFLEPGEIVIKNFGKNLKNEYWNFGSVKDGTKSVKSWLKLTKDVRDDGVGLKLAFKNVVLPGAILIPNGKNDATFGDIADIVEKIKEKIVPSFKAIGGAH